MDSNELISKLRGWYPDLSFRINNSRLYVNNQKLCVLTNTMDDDNNVPLSVVDFIKSQIKEIITDTPPSENSHAMINVPSIGALKKAIFNMPDNWMIIGNCVDQFDRWYNYPCYIGKVPGNNEMVAMQLKPIDENQISEKVKEFQDGAKKIAEELFNMTGYDYKDWIEVEIMKLIGK